ncbi:uncharacterized protein LOC129568812 isoform X2 [Sitodiplosis mosellana]|uniref:uncharacterized protein LOC129568812 isoform X2 n=1 Tax=Sitodiplosis mosellana TaxID=263140 RepID=UPI002444D02B|nr:uncharacterized protein LOC129568812 isoform X2 [Sitodiplosis mosellana]
MNITLSVSIMSSARRQSNLEKTQSSTVKLNEKEHKIKYHLPINQKRISANVYKMSKNISDDLKNKIGNQVAGPSSAESPPSIFKLTIDCCDEIFEYLSLVDLNSLGQTCMAMQKVGGEYYRRNFQGAEKFLQDDGIYTVYADDVTNKRTRTSVFNSATEFLSYYYGEKQPLRYIDWHIDEFTAVKHLYFVCIGLDSQKMEHFQSFFPTLEVLQIRQCILWRDNFYEILLEQCKKLKRLYVQDDLGYIIYNRGTWLLQNYPTLEHIELTPRGDAKINELQQFFVLNPQIRSFCTTSDCLFANRNSLMEVDTKLNWLEIKHFIANAFHMRAEEFNMNAFCNLLNQLHDRDFYKRLHFFVPDVNEQFSDQLVSLHGLEKLTIDKFTNCYNLLQLKHLKELNIFGYANAGNFEILAKSLTNLERILIQEATYNDLLPFVRHSVNLKHMKIFAKEAKQFKGETINLGKLNREREKLFGARKLIIYIEDNVFLATKRTARYGDINLNMIEMRRSNSICWDYDYSTIRTFH